MRSLRAAALLGTALFVSSGCGYIHFGRLPPLGAGDIKLQKAYEDLALEHKILKQELALARQESDALRTALERTSGAPSSDLAQKLATATRELEDLRARQTQPAEAAPSASATTAIASLQSENGRLRRELDTARNENASLAAELKSTLTEKERVEATVSQLNTDLLQQKEARGRAEQATIALRAQLEAVMARAGRAPEATPTDDAPTARPTAAASLLALQGAKAPPSDAAPVVELHSGASHAPSGSPFATPTSDLAPSLGSSASQAPAPLPTLPVASNPTDTPNAAPPAEAASSSTTAAASPTPAPAAEMRTYRVKNGDTLEKIAATVYGAADKWGRIYDANADLLSSSGGLKVGMEIKVPSP